MTGALVVLAKAPVPGRVKTRLAQGLGRDWQAAADLAAAALLDTVAACTVAVGAARCRLVLDGCLDEAVEAAALSKALAGWSILPQVEGGLDERIACAHEDVEGRVLQIGMDTPQVTPALLQGLLGALEHSDAVLAPAADGGWWALGFDEGSHGGLLRGVPMSTPDTGQATAAVLHGAGLRVTVGPTLVDADRVDDARSIAMEAPGTRFARRWSVVDHVQEAS